LRSRAPSCSCYTLRYGESAVSFADPRLVDATVRGVDLFPPPVNWVPPNCLLEVDDVVQEWTWSKKFDLIHMRHMTGSFSPPEWELVYKRCYE
ncbi:unnamed protein product, partial [Penicillium nalgiovense]